LFQVSSRCNFFKAKHIFFKTSVGFEKTSNKFSEKLKRSKSNNCSFGRWLMAGADLFWKKSTAGWLLVAGLF
jgi:hypothetical protein